MVHAYRGIHLFIAASCSQTLKATFLPGFFTKAFYPDEQYLQSVAGMAMVAVSAGLAMDSRSVDTVPLMHYLLSHEK